MKTLIAVPCMDTVPTPFAQSLLFLQKGEDTYPVFQQNSLIYDSRNLLSLYAIENQYDFVLWIDSDMVFPTDALMRLRQTLEDNHADMVTGLYFKRRTPSVPVVYDELEEPTIENGTPVRHIHEFTAYPRDDVTRVRGCGFGFCLTTTKLLKHVWDDFGPAFTPYPWAGEDISFCHRVNKLGYPILLDSRVKCGHIGSFVFSEDTYIPPKEGD